MAHPVPTTVPERLVAGDTWTFKQSFGDYPADPDGDGAAGTWTLTTEVVGSSTDLGTFTATASGADHLTTVAAATTAGWAAGDYSFQQFVTENDTGERHLVGQGWLEVVANLATATTFDGRSHVKKTLDALQFIVQRMVHKQRSTRLRISIDVEGYRDRRKESLIQMALRLGDKVKRSGKPATISPMNAYERRIVHVALKDNAGVRTQSMGQGSLRKLVIYPQRKSKQSAHSRRSR